MQAGGQDQRGAHLRAEPPQHTLNAGIGLAANGCVCLCRVGRKKKRIHPKTKGWERRKKPTQEQSISTIQIKQQQREQGVREETHTHKLQRPAGGASPNHLGRQHLCPTPQQPQPHGSWVLSPALGPSNGDLQRHILENHPEGGWGKQNPEGKRDTSTSQGHTAIHWESSCPAHSPWRLPSDQTPPHRHSALLAPVKREQSSCRQPA